MSDQITVTGRVATDPHSITTGTGLAVTTFRVASTVRKFDRAQSKWVDGETNWFTVASFRDLATNVASCIQKGQPVVVSGRLRIRPWSMPDGRTGTAVEISADAVGHDLRWGTTAYARSASTRTAEAERPEPTDPDAGVPAASEVTVPDEAETPF